MLAYVGYVNGFTHLKCALEKMDRNTTSSKRRIRKERECWVGNAWRCLGTFCGVFPRVSSTTTYICTNSFPANGRRGGTPQQRAGRCTREVGPDTGGYQAFKSLCWRGTVPFNLRCTTPAHFIIAVTCSCIYSVRSGWHCSRFDGLHWFVALLCYIHSNDGPSQAQISGERSAVQQIDELDSQLRFSSAEVWTRAVLAMTTTDNHLRWLIGSHLDVQLNGI